MLNQILSDPASPARHDIASPPVGRERGLSTAMLFDGFTYLPGQALLLSAGQPLRIGSRALDILGCLLAHAGDLVDKATLARWVWPTTVVEEVSIRVHLAALRKVLGDGRDGARYIINVPGRGYRFVAPVRRAALAVASDADARMPPDRLDGRTRELIALVAAACHRHESAVGVHLQAARQLGVGPEAIAEALRLAGATAQQR